MRISSAELPVHRLPITTVGGVALLAGTLTLVVTQGVLHPALPPGAAEQLTVIARTRIWHDIQRASLLVMPLVLAGLLACAAAMAGAGARPWAWMGGGLATYGVMALSLSYMLLSGPAAATRTPVAEVAPIDPAILANFEFILPLVDVAGRTGTFALGLGVGLLGQGLLASALTLPWLGSAVTLLGAIGSIASLVLDRASPASRLAPMSIAAALLLLAAVLFVMPAAPLAQEPRISADERG
ncbi:MAG: hypothetical protein ACREON_07530 [Gemmatimonadaceae bacterium]